MQKQSTKQQEEERNKGSKVGGLLRTAGFAPTVLRCVLQIIIFFESVPWKIRIRVSTQPNIISRHAGGPDPRTASSLSLLRHILIYAYFVYREEINCAHSYCKSLSVRPFSGKSWSQNTLRAPCTGVALYVYSIIIVLSEYWFLTCCADSTF